MINNTNIILAINSLFIFRIFCDGHYFIFGIFTWYFIYCDIIPFRYYIMLFLFLFLCICFLGVFFLAFLQLFFTLTGYFFFFPLERASEALHFFCAI
jgi:hypothetical protein